MAGQHILDRRLLRADGIDLYDAWFPRGDQSDRSARRTASGVGIDRWSPRQQPDVLLRDGRLHAPGSNDAAVSDVALVRAAGRRQPDVRRPLSPGIAERPPRSQADAVTVVDGAR